VLLVYWWSVQLPFLAHWSLPFSLVSMSLLLLLALLFVEPVRDRVFSIFAGREDSSNNFRINVWAAVVEMIRDRPILGIGPGTPPSTKFTLLPAPRFNAFCLFHPTGSCETGFIGLACFIWLFLVVLNQGIYSYNSYATIKSWILVDGCDRYPARYVRSQRR